VFYIVEGINCNRIKPNELILCAYCSDWRKNNEAYNSLLAAAIYLATKGVGRKISGGGGATRRKTEK